MNIWLHRFIKFVVFSTLLLIAAGGMVTSTDSGLAVPDWPNTYGQFMFSFPLEKMVGGIFYEHGHRMIASTVGFLTIILALWTWKADPRRWIGKLGVTALAAVIVQGLLGGITVLLLSVARIIWRASPALSPSREVSFSYNTAVGPRRFASADGRHLPHWLIRKSRKRRWMTTVR